MQYQRSRFAVCLVAVLGLLLVPWGGAAGQSVQFFDDFDSAALDPAWSVVPGVGSFSLTERPGFLRYRVASRFDGSGTPMVRLNRAFTGENWEVETSVSYFLDRNGGGRQFIFSINFGAPPPGNNFAGSNSIYVWRQMDEWFFEPIDPGVMHVNVSENDAHTVIATQPPNIAEAVQAQVVDSPTVWRIRRNGRTVTVERSLDGVSFSGVASHTFGAQIDGLVQYLSLNGNSFANSASFADYDYVRLTPIALTIAIDIKPGSDPNSINLSSAGKIPVAIVSTSDFDAPSEVDPDTLRLAGAAVNLIGKSGKFQCSSQDVNQDGLLDLVCHFETAQLFLEPGDSVAVLEGKTFAGLAIRGEDSVRIVPD